MHQSIQELELCNRDGLDVSNLRLMCEQSIRLCEYRLPEEAHIEIEIPKKIHFLGNKGHISQVLMNLLINSSEAPNTSHLQVRIQAYVEEDNIHVHYRDNSIGIPKELHDNLFSPFTSTKGEKEIGSLYL